MKHITVREALRQAMRDEMLENPNVFIMGEEVAEYNGAYKITQGLLDEFGSKRVIDTPITEYGFTGVAVGAAFAGLSPIVEFMTFNFALQAIDHIINSAAKTHYMSGGMITCPIVFRGPNGAASRVGAQHSQNFASWYGQVPGLKVISPYSAEDAYGLLRAAIRDPNPVVFLENEILYGHSFDVPDVMDIVPIGVGKIVRPGKDVTIVAFSLQVKIAIDAALKLQEMGVEAEVIDIRTIRPFDYDIVIDSVKKTNRLVIVDEGWFFGSVAASIATEVMRRAFDYLDAPVECVNSKDVPMPYASNLEAMTIPSMNDVVEAAVKVCYM